MSAAAIELRLKEVNQQRLQLEDEEKERLLREKKMHVEHGRSLRDVELKHAALRSSTNVEPPEFDVVRYIRLMLPFGGIPPPLSKSA